MDNKILNYEMNDAFKKALHLVLDEHQNVFITGSGGVGKSVFQEVLTHLLDKEGKSHISLAPTGVAALRIKGATIHRFFGFPIGPLDPESVKIKKWNEIEEIVRNLDVLILDEVSMIRSDLFQTVSSALRQIRGSREPFGGVQVVLLGDLFQLGPIVTDKTEKDFLMYKFGGFNFFQSPAYREAQFEFVEFEKCYRQQDQEFKDHLNKIRLGFFPDETQEYMNSRIISLDKYSEEVGHDYVYLVSNNKLRDQINAEKLSSLPGPVFRNWAKISGQANIRESMLEEELILKSGATVMVLRNIGEDIVNGHVGIFEDVVEYRNDEGEKKEALKISLEGNDVLIPLVEDVFYEYTWNKEEKKIEQKELGRIAQYPLTLSWARTIHKSQSATFPKVYLDLSGGFFPAGLVYTALSRVVSHGNLGLSKPLSERHVKVDDDIFNFYGKLIGEIE